MPNQKPVHKAADFNPKVLSLFDQYVHGDIDRRGFLREASRLAVGALTAGGLLEALSPKFAEAQQIPPDDARLDARFVEIASPKGYGKARGYLVMPAKAGKLPCVLVIHENRGLNPHIEDVARRLALENFIAFAPDALFPLGGYPGEEDPARELFRKLEQEKTREDFIAAAHHGRTLSGGNGKLGAVGFCYGGHMANFLATRLPELKAAVPFYGSAPELAAVPAIRAALQIHFASEDPRVNATWPEYEKALKAARIRYQAFTYPETQHGFHNDTTPRYDAQAAKLAWSRTVDFFHQHLR